MSTHSGDTNKVTEVKLPSSIQQVMWTRAMVAPGGTVGLAVFTHFVGSGAEMQIELSDAEGRKHGTFKDSITGNRFTSQIVVPPKARSALFAEVKLPKHSLSMKSPALLLTPVIEVANARWSASEARRGDVLTLEAEVRGAVDGTEGEIHVLEYDDAGAHEPVTSMPVVVSGGTVQTDWSFVYAGDVFDIPIDAEAEAGYQSPRYVFMAEVQGVQAESDVLAFLDSLSISVVDAETGMPYANQPYVAYLADGTTRKGSLDAEGHLQEDDVPPGPVGLELPELQPDEERMESGTPAVVPPVQDVLNVEVDPARPLIVRVRSGSATLIRLHMKPFDLSL